ncbi:hypothetical protein Taro_003595, partial [Colocasia esculenta]|nr:hypothetical protein [Colocasia esculenta]
VYRFCLGSVDTPLIGVDIHPTKEQAKTNSGKRRFERERGICIQRSRVAPPKGEEGEEEGEEEEELEIARVLIQKEIQPKHEQSI